MLSLKPNPVLDILENTPKRSNIMESMLIMKIQWFNKVYGVSECTRVLLLNISLYLKSGIDSSLQSMAVSYAVYTHEHVNNEYRINPTSLFRRTHIPCNRLKYIHVWECPMHILDYALQQRNKLHRWYSRAQQGIIFSTHHSRYAPLVLNISTDHISLKYHIIFINLSSR